jgi:hypothetical protein
MRKQTLDCQRRGRRLSGFDQQIGGACEALKSRVVVSFVRRVFNRVIVSQLQERSYCRDQRRRLNIRNSEAAWIAILASF